MGLIFTYAHARTHAHKHPHTHREEGREIRREIGGGEGECMGREEMIQRETMREKGKN